MRWTGFIIGTVTGMMAASYLAKKRPGMVAWAGAATGDMLSNVKGKAISAVMNRKFGSVQHADPSTAASKSSSQTNSADSWNQIEMLVNADPKLKAETDQIMNESQSQTH